MGDRIALELFLAAKEAVQAELTWLRAQTDLQMKRLRLDALTGALSVQSLQTLQAYLAL